MTFTELQMVVHWVQQTWIELMAAMDYMEIYKPRMDGEQPSPPAAQVVQTMGVFVFLLQVAALYFKARMPYWMNVLEQVPVTLPLRLVHVVLPPGQAIWTGPAGDIKKILAIQETAFGTMGYGQPLQHRHGLCCREQSNTTDVLVY
ncbi:hypothetical protein BDN72DRAFT_906579 [Pluteus cervinus]|uniref:Uncharacterized protein n=1 Tax=Pluteus cervinus TaxID=181527 RepID=A0ACD2ZZ95_9AGAR|nr:hypothetical protein BDN72DRAFT_906579 [Pluteus cervinus]